MLPGRACGTERLCVFRIREAAIAAESSLSLDGGVEEAAKAVEVFVVGWGEGGTDPGIQNAVFFLFLLLITSYNQICS